MPAAAFQPARASRTGFAGAVKAPAWAGARAARGQVGAATARGLQAAAAILLLPAPLLSGAPALAGAPGAVIGGKPAPAPCVMVDIAGYKAGHLDCASQALEAAARAARREAGVGTGFSVPEAGSADVSIGVASRSGASLRMGNALGHSVHPQRPGRTVTPPAMGPRP
ncbi:hypothetical protein L6Q21_17885 [Sandaracinobacter sp. RS1-74]|uniref:hypothetical protein n=1 Tax=Sandaracinobacteroides sayramensis TaxID=2913411 RepID=UPI001EDB4C10|nr:hypothetical protein [Sandaracinobacteroides sayramensis]MCG2842851.1 hypothetical protein [Sandaracinobacteroides sayramensis]